MAELIPKRADLPAYVRASPQAVSCGMGLTSRVASTRNRENTGRPFVDSTVLSTNRLFLRQHTRIPRSADSRRSKVPAELGGSENPGGAQPVTAGLAALRRSTSRLRG